MKTKKSVYVSYLVIFRLRGAGEKDRAVGLGTMKDSLKFVKNTLREKDCSRYEIVKIETFRSVLKQEKFKRGAK